MKNKLLIITMGILMSTISGSVLHALEKISLPGNNGTFFQVNNIGSSAEMIGRGSVQGFSEQASVLFENPASLKLLNKGSVSIFYTKLINELEYKNVAVAYRGSMGMIGVGYMDLGVQGIPKTKRENDMNFQIGSFQYLNSVVKVSYQNSLNNKLSYGVSSSFFKTKMDTLSGKGGNLDVGIMWKTKKMILSYSIKNIIKNNRINFEDSDPDQENNSTGAQEEIPMEMIASAKVKIWDLDLFCQLKNESGKTMKNVAIRYTPRFIKMINFNVGRKELFVTRYIADHNRQAEIESALIPILGVGIGLRIKKVGFDYAYENASNVKKRDSHRHYFSININF